ncbi:reverse transcriptase, partial [Tanacetum coccineum]
MEIMPTDQASNLEKDRLRSLEMAPNSTKVKSSNGNARKRSEGYAINSIFFFRASSAEVINLKNILVRYCTSSGQVINYEKSEVSFSANVEPHVRIHIIESLEVRKVIVQPKYLGLPSIIGGSKKVVFQAIIDKIKKKLQGWKEKTLSIGGKEVLIKLVAQAMPMYVMNIFLLPDTLIDDIHKALNCFWSLLAKQVWRLITNPTTLAAKVLKARYFPRSSFFDANVGCHPSYIWRSFILVKELVRNGCKWNIGDGHRVNVWEDYWLKDHRRLGPKPENCELTYVRDLLNDEGDDWNRELLMSLFPRNICNKITTCFINRWRPNTLYWHNNPNGLFSCKSAYYLELESSQHIVQNVFEESTTLLRAIWNAKVPNKIKLFLWRAWKNYLTTINNLQARGLSLTSVSYTHCDQVGEDVIHVLFKCPSTKQVWDRCNFGRFYDMDEVVTLDDFSHVILNKFHMVWENFLTIQWGLWTRRNKKFHGQVNEKDTNVEVMVKLLLMDYHKANQQQLTTTRTKATVIWTKPNGDYIKFNCDASWQKESGRAGLGFVARNACGDVLLSGARAQCYASSPLKTEAKSLLWRQIKHIIKVIPRSFSSQTLCAWLMRSKEVAYVLLNFVDHFFCLCRPKELTGGVDLLKHYNLLHHYKFFCKKSLPSSISETHYLRNVVGDTEIRKGEGMQLNQLIGNTSLSRDTNIRIQPFDPKVLREAFSLRETAPIELPASEKGVPTQVGRLKNELKDKEKKHKKHKDKDREKNKEHKKHKHRHKDRDNDKDKDKKNDKTNHHVSGAGYLNKPLEKV